MEAKSVAAIPVGAQWQYEPKWDGFRCLLRRDGNFVSMASKSGQDLARYFPEVVEAAMRLTEKHFLLDGELTIQCGDEFSFDALLQRIHPATIRVKHLATVTPAQFIAFDLLQCGKADLAKKHLPERRKALEAFAARCFPRTLFGLSPATTKIEEAKQWLQSARGGCDGVIAKRCDLPYQAGNRDGMQKIKLHRTADCVIGGFRYGETPGARKLVGSLLLGLYDEDGLLHHVGFTSGIKAKEKRPLTDTLEAIIAKRSFTGATPGGPSRWSSKRSSEWIPVQPKLVVEISYDHFTEGRFRHGTSLLRWRPDKKPKQCTMVQLRQKVSHKAN
jgi:ATP-dependent DNA ligase